MSSTFAIDDACIPAKHVYRWALQRRGIEGLHSLNDVNAGDALGVVMDEILYRHASILWQGRSFDGAEAPFFLESSDSECEVYGLYWYLGGGGESKQIPVHLRLKQLGNTTTYALCIGSEHTNPNKLWSDFYLFARDEYWREWTWSYRCEGVV